MKDKTQLRFHHTAFHQNNTPRICRALTFHFEFFVLKQQYFVNLTPMVLSLMTMFLVRLFSETAGATASLQFGQNKLSVEGLEGISFDHPLFP